MPTLMPKVSPPKLAVLAKRLLLVLCLLCDFRLPGVVAICEVCFISLFFAWTLRLARVSTTVFGVPA